MPVWLAEDGTLPDTADWSTAGKEGSGRARTETEQQYSVGQLARRTASSWYGSGVGRVGVAGKRA